MLRLVDEGCSLDSLITKYPTSGLFYEARFLLGWVDKELNKPDEAIKVLKDVFSRATDPNLINRATIELASLQDSTRITQER